MTIATILLDMAVFDNELFVNKDGKDEARGIRAINIVQRWFEAIVAGDDEAFQTFGNITQTLNTETTSWPTDLLRLDDLWLMDTTITPNLPVRRLDPIDETGGHRPAMLGVTQLVALTITTGKPFRYWATQPPGGVIFWEQIPDAAHTIRWYGLVAQADYTVRTDTFGYPPICGAYFSQQSAKILRMGRDDSIADLRREADVALRDALKASRHWRSTGPVGRQYQDVHVT